MMIAVMLAFPNRCAGAASGALKTWALSVAPSLFPYMVFCRMLSAQLRRTRLPPAPAAAFLGLLGGSPSGAAVLGAYAAGGRLSRKRLLSLCALTGTISPMFMLNTAGAWLGGGAVGRCLLASHLLGAMLAMGFELLLLGGTVGEPRSAVAPESARAADPIVESVHAILSVGGCIVFYSVLAEGIAALLPLPPAIGALLHSVFEAAGGVHAISRAGFTPHAQAILAAAACGFSGLSILSQNLLFVRPFGVRMGHLLAAGLLRAALSALLMALFLALPAVG